MDKNKIVIAFGTRPEAIKMCPLIKELKARSDIQTVVIFTGQHREIAEDVMRTFGIVPDYDMNIMRPSQSLFDITVNILDGIKELLCRESPSAVVVHGDTTTAFAVSLASFYMNIPIAHVEAGLRSHNMNSPFPEEFNRRAVALAASYHFAPTHLAAENLWNEGIPASQVYITGNTVIDSLDYTLCKDFKNDLLPRNGERLIFVTAHRRENVGEPLKNMLNAVKNLAKEHTDVKVLYPVHPNGTVRQTAEKILGGCERITLCPPLEVTECHNILARSHIILTDSGGIQEEAAALRKPVLIMRNETERPEGILAGVARLAGTDRLQIEATVNEVLNNEEIYIRMSSAKNPYGDGKACEKIADILCQNICV